LAAQRYSNGRKRHFRRCANEIARQYTCPYEKCSKSYASEGSLNLHIKIKHNGGNKTDRERIAKSLIFAKANGYEITKDIQIQLNLPPGSVKNAASKVGFAIDNNSIERMENEVQKQAENIRRRMKQDELQGKISATAKVVDTPKAIKQTKANSKKVDMPKAETATAKKPAETEVRLPSIAFAEKT